MARRYTWPADRPLTRGSEAAVDQRRVLRARPLHLLGADRRGEDLTAVADRHRLAPGRVHDERVPGVARAGLADRGDVRGVPDGPRGYQGPPVLDLAGPGDPGRRYDEELGAEADQLPRQLGEPQVVARHQPDPDALHVHEHRLHRSGQEPVGLAVAEGVVEMDLSVGRDEARGPDHDQGV